MAAACALAIFSGKNIFYFGFQESLRTFLKPIFTGEGQIGKHLPLVFTTPLVKMRLERSAERDKREL